MNPREFFDKVAAMRAAQISFFSTSKGDAARSQYYDESKRLEAEIDKEIARVKSILNSK